ncbi:MAG TPA: acyltransferase, partial [Acidimicrobiales bacterium]|nr:acyltransferase [Acidimicrobiales bacterium]
MTAVDTAEDPPEATTSRRETSALGAPPTRPRRKRPRLDHVDAMRPVKQGGVVTTHSLLFFAPAGGIGVGASLLVTHVTRFAFMFISAAMLVYAYPELRRGALGVFWRRRLLAVALPYVTWTLIYFGMESLPIPGIPEAFRPTGGLVASVPRSLEHLGVLLVTGYYQLYYLVILLEFYVIYPAFLWLIRRTDGHHRAVFVISLALQLALVLLEQTGVVPGWMQGHGAIRELWNYQLYVVAGGIMAWHYQAIHAWLCRRWRVVVGATLVTFVVAEAWYVVAATHLLGFPGDPSGAFQPAVIPFFVALIAALYLLGV